VKARELQRKVSRFYDVFSVGNYYSGFKEAVNQAGRPAGYPRKPLLPLTPEERGQIKIIMDELGLSARV
jgi:dihydrodipicolinate synthase/N-acetylneuraminate lyase